MNIGGKLLNMMKGQEAKFCLFLACKTLTTRPGGHPERERSQRIYPDSSSIFISLEETPFSIVFVQRWCIFLLCLLRENGLF